MENSEQLLADLRKRSTSIAPLKLRRTNVNKPITVESLCDWDTDKVELLYLKLKVVRDLRFPWFISHLKFSRSFHIIATKGSLSRGEKFSLKSNSDVEKWDIVAPDGSTKTFPGVCFQIPRPDPAAIDKVDLYVLSAVIVHSCRMEDSMKINDELPVLLCLYLTMS